MGDFGCQCPNGRTPTGRGCPNRATQEDMLCDDCRIHGHGHVFISPTGSADEWIPVGTTTGRGFE